MARIYKGILGGFSGTVGTVVGATWRGIDIMRSRPKKTNRIPTPGQAEQRERFALTIDFLIGIRPLLRIFFGQPAGEKSKSNLATAYHLTEAIAGAFPGFTIDFPKVIISKGELLGLQDTTVAPLSGAELKINWTDNSGQGQARTDDLMMFAVYNETKSLWEYQAAAASRTLSTFTIALPNVWVGNTVHCWLAIASANDKKYSISEYVGPLVVV